MRIPSGVVDQYVYFVAVDSTDFVTRETGLSSFTVYRSRDGAAAAVMTTPTINETDATNMPGVYELILDEDMTIGSGNDTEAMVFHITQASMAPVTIQIELYRPKITAGETLTVASGTASADAVSISGDSTAADNLEATYDGTGYTDDAAPATQAQIGAIGSSSGGALNFEVEADNTGGSIKSIAFVGVQTGTFANTEAEDASFHQIDDTGNAIDIVYQFDIGGNRTASEVILKGYLTGSNDSLNIQAYDYVGADWETRAILTGQAGSTNITQAIPLLSKHTGTGADLGKVLLRFQNTGQSNPTLFVDELLAEGIALSQSVGYALGAIWVDTVNGTAGTETYVNGVADNPVDSWADALTINSALGTNKFVISAGSSVTLTGTSDNFALLGANWSLALGGQSIDGIYVEGASITGIGEATTTAITLQDCTIGAATIPPGHLNRCGIGDASGTFTAPAGSGEYIFENCLSVVAGSGSPTFDFSPVTGTTGINNRRWSGGATYTLDSNCALSHEVLAGGTTTVTTGGADVEIRGTTRDLAVTMSAAETVQFVGITGPITLDGTTTATVNLYGVAEAVTDTTSAATVDNQTVSRASSATATGFALASVATEARLAELDAANLPTDIAAIPTTAMRGTDNAALASVATEARLAELDAGNLPADVGAIPTTAMRGTDNAALATSLATAQLDLDTITGADGVNLLSATQASIDAIETDTGTTLPATLSTLDGKIDTIDSNVDAVLVDTGTDIPARFDGIEGATFVTGTDSLEEIRNRGDAAWTTGSGGDATEAKQDTIITNLATVDTVVDGIQTDLDNGTDGLGAIKAAVDAISGGAGDGARTVTVTVDDGAGNNLENVRARYTEGGNTYTSDTGSDGVVSPLFNLNDATYTVALYKSGYTYGGTTHIISADAAVTYSMTAIPSAGTPTDPTLCRVTGTAIDINGAVKAGVEIEFQLIGAAPIKDGTNAIAKRAVTVTTNASGQIEDSDGNAYIDLVRTDGLSPSGSYYYWVNSPDLRFRKDKLELEAATYSLDTLIT